MIKNIPFPQYQKSIQMCRNRQIRGSGNGTDKTILTKVSRSFMSTHSFCISTTICEKVKSNIYVTIEDQSRPTT